MIALYHAPLPKPVQSVRPPRFGLTDTDAIAATLNRKFARFEAYWNGAAYLRDMRNRVCPAKMEPTRYDDAAEVGSWYEPSSDNRPYYQDKTWHQWWIDQIHESPNLDLYKLKANDAILGVIALEKQTTSIRTGKPITKIGGIRIAPQFFYAKDMSPQKLKGIGSALLTFATVESLKRGTSGVCLNSTVGVEAFYVNRFGPSPCKAPDGVRDYFELTDTPGLNGKTRLSFLEDEFRWYDDNQAL